MAAWNQFEGHLQDRIRRMGYLKQNGAGTRRDTKDVGKHAEGRALRSHCRAWDTVTVFIGYQNGFREENISK